MAKIALAMIVADKEPMDMLKRCLKSVAPHVDGIYLTLNGKTEEETDLSLQKREDILDFVANENFVTPVIDYIKWEKDFSKARNHNFEQVGKEFDYILWLDTDDILRGGDKLHELAEEGLQKNFGAIFFNYLYKVDVDKDNRIRNVLIEHLRERLIRNDGSYKWIAPIHETLIEQRETDKTDTGKCDVVHLSSEDRTDAAMQRNTEILELQLESQGNRKDPRTMYYLAKCYFDLRGEDNWAKAEKLILDYLNGSEQNTPSGWAEERAQGWEYLSEIYRERGHFNKALKAIANALLEDPKFPNFYIDMGLIYLYMHDWQRARFWALLAQHVPYPKTTLVQNPRDMQLRTLEILFQVAINTNDLEGAWASATKILEFFPNDQLFIDRVKSLEKVRENNKHAHEIISLARYLSNNGQGERVTALVNAMPKEIEDEPVMISLRRDFTPPRRWADNEVAIVCGRGFEQWSPKSLDKGIGGSEEAVILVSKELTKLGWKVTVYADPQDDEGEHDGVTYLPYYKLNQNDEFNILIGWRSVGMFDNKWNAKKTFLWNHDIQNAAEYTQLRQDRINKIFMLSNWHRQNIPNVPDEKFLITANGVSLPALSDVKRDPHAVFYGSSYDRGLEHLLKMWEGIRKEVPDATLHVCYGWNLFESFYRNNPERMMWKAKMDKLMEQPGIIHHGRVGHPELENIMLSCGVWAYPTHFGEISCITAMRAQMLGCIPVVTNYAALKETVKYGVKIDVEESDIYEPEKKEEFSKELIRVLKDTNYQVSIRDEMMDWSIANYSWKKIASDWDEEFRSNELKEAAFEVLKEKPEAKKYLPYEVQKEMGHEQTY